MPFVAIAFAVFLVKEAVTLVKQISARHFREAATLIVAFVVGIAVAFLLCGAKVAANVHFGDIPFSQLDGASIVQLGLELGAAAAFGYDIMKVQDNNQSAAEPALLEGVTVTPPAA